MKKLLFLAALLAGCGYADTPTFTQEPPAKAPHQVELPGNIHGVYVKCGSDLECQSKCVGVCKEGYWIAEYMSAATPPHQQTGIVIVCGKSPSMQ